MDEFESTVGSGPWRCTVDSNGNLVGLEVWSMPEAGSAELLTQGYAYAFLNTIKLQQERSTS